MKQTLQSKPLLFFSSCFASCNALFHQYKTQKIFFFPNTLIFVAKVRIWEYELHLGTIYRAHLGNGRSLGLNLYVARGSGIEWSSLFMAGYIELFYKKMACNTISP